MIELKIDGLIYGPLIIAHYQPRAIAVALLKSCFWTLNPSVCKKRWWCLPSHIDFTRQRLKRDQIRMWMRGPRLLFRSLNNRDLYRRLYRSKLIPISITGQLIATKVSSWLISFLVGFFLFLFLGWEWFEARTCTLLSCLLPLGII